MSQYQLNTFASTAKRAEILQLLLQLCMDEYMSVCMYVCVRIYEKAGPETKQAVKRRSTSQGGRGLLVIKMECLFIASWLIKTHDQHVQLCACICVCVRIHEKRWDLTSTRNRQALRPSRQQEGCVAYNSGWSTVYNL